MKGDDNVFGIELVPLFNVILKKNKCRNMLSFQPVSPLVKTYIVTQTKNIQIYVFQLI